MNRTLTWPLALFLSLILALNVAASDNDFSSYVSYSHWGAKLETLKPDQQVLIDGHELFILSEFSRGAGGRVFKAMLRGEEVVLKFWLPKPGNRFFSIFSLETEVDALNTLGEYISVSDVIHFSKSKKVLVKKLIPGKIANRWREDLDPENYAEQILDRAASFYQVAKTLFENKIALVDSNAANWIYNKKHGWTMIDPGGINKNAQPKSLEGSLDTAYNSSVLDVIYADERLFLIWKLLLFFEGDRNKTLAAYKDIQRQTNFNVSSFIYEINDSHLLYPEFHQYLLNEFKKSGKTKQYIRIRNSLTVHIKSEIEKLRDPGKIIEITRKIRYLGVNSTNLGAEHFYSLSPTAKQRSEFLKASLSLLQPIDCVKILMKALKS